ncbi:MAG: flagellar hook capping FlgD N-terminal domain-containing protein [Phycisphaerales bacterium]
MEAVSAIGADAGRGGSAANAFSGLSSESFIKIIFSELGHQDPLAPSDSKALLDQLSSLRTIQSSMDMSQRLGALVAQNELAAASGMIGKTVSGLNGSFLRVAGEVKSVSRTEGGAVLNLVTGERVPMSYVDEVLGAGGGAP